MWLSFVLKLAPSKWSKDKDGSQNKYLAMIPDAVCVLVSCQVLTAGVVVADDVARGPSEVLETAVRRSVLGVAGDLPDQDVPALAV